MKDDKVTPLARASEIARVAKLKSLVISQAEFGFALEISDEEPTFYVTGQRHAVEGGSLRTQQTLGLRAPFEDDPGESTVRVQAVFDVVYDISDAEDPATESVDAFARINSLYNAWPYWREFVQSSVQRMGLPTLMVPLLTGPMAAILSGLGPPQREKKAVKKKARKHPKRASK
jgi:hypothetical protein